METDFDKNLAPLPNKRPHLHNLQQANGQYQFKWRES